MADHARKLVDTMRTSIGKTLKRLGVQVLEGRGRLNGPHGVVVRSARGIEREITAAHVIVATGSEPFVPRGIERDGRTVFTSDEALQLSWLPPWIAVVGSGYIGLEFADIYTALGCEVTLIEALDQLMPSFDADIRKLATRHLVEARDIEAYTGVLASKVDARISRADRTAPCRQQGTGGHPGGGRGCWWPPVAPPVSQDLNLASVGVATERGFIPVDERLRVLKDGQPVGGAMGRGGRDGQAHVGPCRCRPGHCGLWRTSLAMGVPWITEAFQPSPSPIPRSVPWVSPRSRPSRRPRSRVLRWAVCGVIFAPMPRPWRKPKGTAS